MERHQTVQQEPSPPKFHGGLQQEGTAQSLLVPNLPCCRSPTPCLLVPVSLGKCRGTGTHPTGAALNQQLISSFCYRNISMGIKSTHFATEITLEKSPFFWFSYCFTALCSFGKKGREEDVMLNRPRCSLAASALLLMMSHCFRWNTPSPELQQNGAKSPHFQETWQKYLANVCEIQRTDET